ncbi:MAG: MBL fold metallo-hydrolase [bacterium]
MRNYKKIIQLVSLLAVVSAILIIVAAWQARAQESLEINFFNVGHGDAIFIRTPNDQRILIDGGLGNQVIQKLGQRLPFFDRRIDVVILTHPHPDHITGLISVIKRYQIGKIFYTNVKTQEELFTIFKNESLAKNIPLIKVDKITSQDLVGEVVLNFLYPDHDLNQEIIEEKDINNTSIVFKLIYKKSSFLFVGDAGEEEEKGLIASGQNLKADVLKIGHHGSNTSSSQEFTQAVSPQFAVITCGENYNLSHPSLRVIRRLERVGAKIYRTDQAGDIKISTSGNGQYRIKTD